MKKPNPTTLNLHTAVTLSRLQWHPDTVLCPYHKGGDCHATQWDRFGNVVMSCGQVIRAVITFKGKQINQDRSE